VKYACSIRAQGVTNKFLNFEELGTCFPFCSYWQYDMASWFANISDTLCSDQQQILWMYKVTFF